jgi:hypothetical protein
LLPVPEMESAQPALPTGSAPSSRKKAATLRQLGLSSPGTSSLARSAFWTATLASTSAI